jgi:hypothetical protein
MRAVLPFAANGPGRIAIANVPERFDFRSDFWIYFFLELGSPHPNSLESGVITNKIKRQQSGTNIRYPSPPWFPASKTYT